MAPGRFRLEHAPARNVHLDPFHGVVLRRGLIDHDYYDGADSSRLHRTPSALLCDMRRDVREASLGHFVSLFSSSSRLTTCDRFQHGSP